MRLFAHRLALAVGTADVSGLLDCLPHRDLLAWVAYFEREPWGETRADVRSAIIAATSYNMQRARGQPARQVADFMAHKDKVETTRASLAGVKAAMMAGLIKGAQHADPDKPYS
jgi:hypothetical protein